VNATRALALGALVVATAAVTHVAAAGWRDGIVYAAEPAKGPTVGEVAPEVQLGDQHGNTFALGDALKAREFVVIAFYPKAFTGG
jgi:hypothetical protein